MARLKVKQISDFTTAVQYLIDNDSDQNAADISSALSAGVSAGANADGVQTNLDGVSDALSVEISSTNSDVVRIDDLLASAAGNSDVTDVSTALSVEISSTNSDVVRIDNLLASVATDGELSTDVASIDTRISNEESTRSTDVKAVSDAVVAILAGSTTDLDQFAEVIAYVDSLDTADGGALTAQIASLETVVSTNTSSDVVLSTALSTEISATNSEVASIDAVLASVGGATAVNAVSDALSVEISSTNSDVVRIDDIIASAADNADLTGLSTALSVEISSTNSDVVRIDDDIDSLEDMVAYREQGGTVSTPTQFTIPVQVAFGQGDDLLVFINGHNIHKSGAIEGSADGYTTVNGTTFNLVNIGYDIDAEDHVMVLGHRA